MITLDDGGALRPVGSPGKQGHRGVGVFVVIALAILAGGVGIVALRPHPAAETATSSAEIPTPRPRPPLRSAPTFPITLYQGSEDLGGEHIALADLWRQGKPVVLNFWAGLCSPCRAEMPDFQELSTTLAKGKWTMIGIDVGPFVGLGTREEGKALLRELNISFPAGTTFEEDTVNVYQLIGMPTTVFITPDGRIFKQHAGQLTRDQMRTLVYELLQASGLR